MLIVEYANRKHSETSVSTAWSGQMTRHTGESLSTAVNPVKH